MTDEQKLRAKIGAYAAQLSSGEAESGGKAVASYLRLILLGVIDPRPRVHDHEHPCPTLAGCGVPPGEDCCICWKRKETLWTTWLQGLNAGPAAPQGSCSG